MKNYSVYVIKSKKNGRRYIGYTSKNVNERLKDHNTSCNTSTIQGKSFKLIYYEVGYCKRCAMKRERFLKSGQGRKILDLIDRRVT